MQEKYPFCLIMIMLNHGQSTPVRRLKEISLLFVITLITGWGCVQQKCSAQEWKTKAILRGGESVPAFLTFSSDGRILASSGGDGTVTLWDFAKREQIATLSAIEQNDAPPLIPIAPAPLGKAPTPGAVEGKRYVAFPCLAFSPDGKTLVGSSSGSGAVRFWDVASMKETGMLNKPSHWVTAVLFSTDGKVLAVASYNGIIRLWNLPLADGPPLATLKAHDDGLFTLAHSGDGKVLASGSIDATVKLWSVATHQNIAVLKGHSNAVYSVAFSPDGKTLASASRDKTVLLWDVASGKLMATLEGHTEGIVSVVYSPDGKMIASGGFDKTVKIWDAVSRKEIAALKGHSDRITSVAFSPDGKTLVSAGVDKTIRLWKMAGP